MSHGIFGKMDNSKYNNSLIKVIITIIVLILIYQLIIGYFIKNKCEANSLEEAIKTATPQEIKDVDKRNFVQKEYKNYLYKECLKKWWLLDF